MESGKHLVGLAVYQKQSLAKLIGGLFYYLHFRRETKQACFHLRRHIHTVNLLDVTQKYSIVCPNTYYDK